ncbi:hypothetical protein ABZ570_21480 [Micromonospora sp. NPDC007271]|uniref:hypothetical protein n=1 Tax=Micromonospora sp. NPDC007271 TaxID=3154587 RepID=UPI0033FD7A33
MTIEKPLSEVQLAPIGDPRVRFYLDHQQAIDTWAQLREEANQALHDLLLDLVDILANDASSLPDGDDIEVSADTDDLRKPRIVIARRRWMDRGKATAAIVIEWGRHVIDDHGEATLFVGVRAGERGRRNQAVSAKLSRLAPRMRSDLGGHPWQREDDSFPVWRWVLPEGTGIDELAWMAQIRDAAWRCWKIASEHIDRIVGEEA